MPSPALLLSLTKKNRHISVYYLLSFDDFGGVTGNGDVIGDVVCDDTTGSDDDTVAGDMLYAVGHASREEELQRMVAELIILAVERDKTGSG